MKVGIIGAGLIGNKRAKAIKDSPDNVVAIADLDSDKAKKLSLSHKGSAATKKYRDILDDREIDCVVVATTHNNLAKITKDALKRGKHVLAEKPLGLNTKDVSDCINLAKERRLVYKAGYNHRFHPGIFKAKTIVDNKKIGKLMYLRAVYGHGGRPGYEKEWRTKKEISGGGELIDQGAHLIDLANWFLGDNRNTQSYLDTFFWPISPVEDNVFLIMKNIQGVALIHASWTQWKNTFRFEVFGKQGYLIVNGLGGSYGEESLTMGIRAPGKAPKERVWRFKGEDISWKNEWKNFRNAILKKEKLVGSGKEGLLTLKTIENIYR